MSNTEWNSADVRQRRLCHRCVGEAFLRDEMRREGMRRKCFYCGRPGGRTYSIAEMCERIESVFEEHYRRTPEEPDGMEYAMQRDRELDYEWWRSGDTTAIAIMNAADMPQNAAGDIQALLAEAHRNWDDEMLGVETPFSDEAHYEEAPASDRRWQEEWHEFERSLKTEARFMSRSAAAHLERVFSGLDAVRTRSGRSCVKLAGPDTDLRFLHRARVFQSDDPLEEAIRRPDLHLGPPPARHASAGRMNARGISVFYGATAPAAALAEVRPPVGSKVVVARFEIVRTLRLLDLAALREAVDGGSVFDPTLSERMARAMFLRSLGHRITEPVMPDDQDLEYLATQAIADFLSTEYDPPLDGILFPSVQTGEGNDNVVLFHKASRVEPMELAEGSRLESRSGTLYEEGWEWEYAVHETYPAARPGKVAAADDHWLPDAPDAFPTPQAALGPVASLRVDRETITVHHVSRVRVETEEHTVRLLRREERDPAF